MSVEHGPLFMPDATGGLGSEEVHERQVVKTRQELRFLDLGADYKTGENLGPSTPWESSAILDAAEIEYIDTRQDTGPHCMDDNVTLPGVQLPGGLLETWIVSRLMTPQAKEQRMSTAYQQLIPKIRNQGIPVWVHGEICAASAFKRQALLTNAENDGPAYDFTAEVMEAMKLECTEEEVRKAIFTGKERALKDRLWDMSARTALQENRQRHDVLTEDFHGHNVAGLRIDATSNRFNNELFRQNHQTEDGRPLGILSVTMGAYKQQLEKLGFEPKDVRREIMHASLFTFGLALSRGNAYLQAGLIVPK